MTKYETDLDLNGRTIGDTMSDHGVLRDDGQKDRPVAEGAGTHLDEGNNPVLMPSDERFPNAPDTLNADKGSRPAEETANRENLNTQELVDAYAQTDPGVTPKA